MSESGNYRARIYGQYVSARDTPLAPENLRGLDGRKRYMRRFVANYFPGDRSAPIYELGCGHGALIHFARESGYRNIRGVDGSPQQVAAAARLGITGVSQGDIFAALADIEDASLGAVIAFDVIEHFTRDEAILLVDDIFRVLRVGGRLIVHLPNAESPFFGAIRFGDLTHEMAYTRQSLSQLLRSSGFGAVSCHEDKPVPGSVKGYVRSLLWAAIRMLLRFYGAIETGDTGRAALYTRNFVGVAIKE